MEQKYGQNTIEAEFGISCWVEVENPKRDFNYYYEKLNYVNRNTLEKLGPDIFWSVGNEEEDISGDNNVDANANEINNTEKTETGKLVKREGDIKRSSFKDLVNELSNELHISKRVSTDEVATSTSSRQQQNGIFIIYVINSNTKCFNSIFQS